MIACRLGTLQHRRAGRLFIKPRRPLRKLPTRRLTVDRRRSTVRSRRGVATVLSRLRSRLRLPVRRHLASLRLVRITRCSTQRRRSVGCRRSSPSGRNCRRSATGSHSVSLDPWHQSSTSSPTAGSAWTTTTRRFSGSCPDALSGPRLIDHVGKDLVTGTAGQWDVSVDGYHGRVIGARLAGDATVKATGFALPILVPRVGDLDWDAVKRIRKLKAMTRLREVLREVRAEAYEAATPGRDFEAAARDGSRSANQSPTGPVNPI